jgi:nucleoid DNA-binding protein
MISCKNTMHIKGNPMRIRRRKDRKIMEKVYVSRAEIINMVAQNTGISRQEVSRIVESYESVLYDLIMNDCTFRMGKLGSFQFYTIKGQTRRIQNFQTGDYELKEIPAKSGIKFAVNPVVEKTIKRKTTGDPYIE